MSRPIALSILCLVSGCAGLLKPVTLQDLPLPAVSNLSCCWQVQELLSLDYQDTSLSLSAVVAVEPEKLTVVMFDHLGHRIATVVQTGTGVEVVASREVQDKFPVHRLLWGIYLSYLPADFRDARDRQLHIDHDNGIRVLRHNGHELARTEKTNMEPGGESDNPERSITFPGYPLTIRIKILERSQL